MGSLLEDINKDNAKNRLGAACGVADLLDSLTGEDRIDLEAAMANPAIKHASIIRVVKARLPDFPATSIARHRSGECKCG